jgi:hypothetical protein
MRNNKYIGVQYNRVNVRKILSMIGGLLILSLGGYGQEMDFSDTFKDLDTRKNSIYFEGMGNGAYGSLNYERLFFKVPQRALALRAGISLVGDSDNLQLVLPFELTLLFGKRNCLETGPGITISPGANDYLLFYRIGYRLRTDSGVMMRVAPLLIYLPGWYIGLYGGVSFGFSF